MTTINHSITTTVPAKRAVGSRLLPEGSAGAVTEWYPTRWPRVGGKAVLKLPDDAFVTERFLTAYRPGKLVFGYCAGCGEDNRMPVATGLLGLARRLRMGVHKVSVTAQVNLRDRMRELNADRYGALTTSVDGHLCSDLGYDNWMLQHILPPSGPLPGSPVTLAERSLAIRLPHDLSVREFDKRLHSRMRNAALNPWLASQAGQAHCALLGVNPAELMRATGYGFGEVKRASVAQEFYFFRPKSRDAERLLRIVELIIYDHVVNPRRRVAASWKSRGQGYGTGLRPSI
ncbi:hypothetical protein SAMN05428997_1244 [Bosea sp. CRIB-10]|jgi:hypothetical protein|uniref:hypothetical protein n=1 Tax=Bosea sp. CRIB-10 TaxID=378404 RepID=UPI0008E46B10|nr:hypothetical protein [Bosea sp. CRIB-10]SFD30512.1 hypothetical protein SAMN05428997_1244 [Bosea sp. CRIB-10]